MNHLGFGATPRCILLSGSSIPVTHTSLFLRYHHHQYSYSIPFTIIIFATLSYFLKDLNTQDFMVTSKPEALPFMLETKFENLMIATDS